MRILALQLKRIGDVILTTPALQALRDSGARVSLLVESGCASLLPAISPPDEKLVYRRRGGNGQLWRRLRAGGWDTVLDFTGNDRSAFMTLLAKAPRRITFAWVRERWWKRFIYREFADSPVRQSHTCDHYLDLVRALKIEPSNHCVPSLDLPATAFDSASKLLATAGLRDAFVLLHPGSARPEKYWPADRWAEIVCNLRARGQCVAITCGPEVFEQQHAREIMLAVEKSGRSFTRPMALVNPPDLPALTALVAKAQLILSCDTSVVHLAAAFQKPQITLFGPTNPFHWRPRHANALVLSAASPGAPLTDFQPKMKGAPMQQLPALPVWKAAEHLLSHVPSASASADTI